MIESKANINPPIKKITLFEREDPKISQTLWAEINEKEELVVEGYDVGDMVEQFWPSDDYEYWLTVPKEYKDTVLLWLIKDRFDDDMKFREWLESKGIPWSFENWI